MREVNMEEMTIEKEFQARVFFHQTTILGGYLMNEYINNEKAKGGIQLPDFILAQEADKATGRQIQRALEDGTFKTLYEKAWNSIKQDIPEYLKLL